MFLPKSARACHRDRRSWCRWCCARGARGSLLKLRDGPIDYFFCDTAHAELWLHHRRVPLTWKLCRTRPCERLVSLGGRSMSDEISRLLSDECAHSPP